FVDLGIEQLTRILLRDTQVEAIQDRVAFTFYERRDEVLRSEDGGQRDECGGRKRHDAQEAKSGGTLVAFEHVSDGPNQRGCEEIQTQHGHEREDRKNV